MYERLRYPFPIIGHSRTLPKRYRYSCGVRLWPMRLSLPSNDNYAPAKRIMASFVRYIRYTATMARRFARDRAANAGELSQIRTRPLSVNDA